MKSCATARYLLLLSAVAALMLPGSAIARQYKPDELLVQVKPGKEAAFEKHAKLYGLAKKKSLKQIRFKLLKVPKGLTLQQAADRLKSHPAVEYVGPNHRIYAVANPPQRWPDDPVFYDGYDLWDMGILLMPPQWGLYNDGYNLGLLPGKPRADIHAPEAWHITTGSPNIIIANIDTGVDYTHEDLWGRVLIGYNAIDGSTNTMDDNGHGTFTAGISSALSNNYKGITGVAWGCPLLPVKVLGASGEGDEVDAAEGIIWAVNNGAKILNMSFATDLDVPALKAAIDYAWQQGCISVCASGNENTSVPRYPAAYPNAVAVGATNQNDQRCTPADWLTGGSNYGNYLDIAAPGNEITSTYSDPDPFIGQIYLSAPGTSAAAPFVSGIAALVWSQNPTWTNQQVVDQILRSADDVDVPGWDQYTGWGRANAYRALTETFTVTSSIGLLHSKPDGAYVEIIGKVVTAGSSQIPGMMYLEEPNRSSGIMVYYGSAGVPFGYAPGNRVNVIGSLGTRNGEKAIVGAVLSNKTAGTALDPVGITNRQAAAAPQASMLRGMLVKVWGRVTEAGFDYFYLDDGSGVDDGSGYTGIRIPTPPPTGMAEGQTWSVIGCLGRDLPTGATDPIPVVRPRRPGDIIRLK